MPNLKIENGAGDSIDMKQHDNHFYMHFTMLNGMATFSFELTRDEGIAIASYVAATALGGNWK